MRMGVIRVENNLALILSRSLLAIALLLIGLNDYHGLLKLPHVSEEGAEFIGALKDTGYLFWTVKLVEVTAALALLGGVFVPLATLFVFPVLINILLFHTFIDPGFGTFIAILMLCSAGYIFYAYRDLFKYLWHYNLGIDPNSFRQRDQVPKARKSIKAASRHHFSRGQGRSGI